MFRIFLAAAAVLSLSVATARAQFLFDTTYYYETSWKTPAATGTPVADLPLASVGGLCSPGTSNCPQNGLLTAEGGPLVAGTGTSSVSGQISFTTPTAGLDNGQYWLMTISVDANSNSTLTGDIWDVVLNGSSLGTTNVVLDATDGSCLGTVGNSCTNTSQTAAQSSGAFDVNVGGGVTETVGITDLLSQYITHTDTLPGLLTGDGANDPLNGGTVSSSYYNPLLQFSVSLTAAPEPASIVLLGGALTLLGAFRWTRRTSSARTI